MTTKTNIKGMSIPEKMAATYMKKLKVYWEYERAVYLQDDYGRPRVWTPDFYLPELGMYVEVVGNSALADYKWREKIYKANKVPIVFVYTNEDTDWKATLLHGIHNIHQARCQLIAQCPK